MRGTGWLVDPPGSCDTDLLNLPGLVGSGALPPAIDLSNYVAGIHDQGATESCVAFALALSIQSRAAYEGRRLPFPSALHLYWMARWKEAFRDDSPDRGSYPRLAVEVLKEHGVCAEARWPFVPSAVNVRPPWDAHQHAMDARIAGTYAIESNRVAGLQRALASGHFPVFGTVVDDLVDHAGTEIVGPNDGRPYRGAHMQMICGYGTTDARRWFLVAGSWGRGYGFGGFTRIAAERFEESTTSNIFVPTLLPPRLS